jgi:hypothetical protein
MIPPLEFEFRLSELLVDGEWGCAVKRLHFLESGQVDLDSGPPEEASDLARDCTPEGLHSRNQFP